MLSIFNYRAVELANSIEVDGETRLPQVPHSQEFTGEFATFSMGKSLFDLKEYRRAAHWLKNCKSDEGFFLRCYSLYLVHNTLLVSSTCYQSWCYRPSV